MVDESTYQAKIGCWNCDSVYAIAITKGTNIPEHMINNEPKCTTCGCDTLKMFNEYIAEKKIMKDVILHHRIEQLGGEEEKPPNNDYNHIG